MKKKAVILLSGGLDSATVAAMAKAQGFSLHCLSFNYGQRHEIELHAARLVAQANNASEHKIVNLDLRIFGGSSLTSDTRVPKNQIDKNDRNTDSQEIPSTYVPARNTIFLSFALAYAETLGSQDIFLGANQVDYSAYPDCRPAFIDAFQKLAAVATKAGVLGNPCTIHAPLMNMTKNQIISEGIKLLVDYRITHSCYDPQENLACGECDSCLLRQRGFAEAHVADPTRYVYELPKTRDI